MLGMDSLEGRIGSRMGRHLDDSANSTRPLLSLLHTSTYDAVVGLHAASTRAVWKWPSSPTFLWPDQPRSISSAISYYCPPSDLVG